MATGAPGTNGVWQYGEDDSEATFSALLNKAASTTNTQLGLDRARLNTLEASGRIVNTVQTNKTNVFSVATANAWVDITGLSATITPKASNNKIAIVCAFMANVSATSDLWQFRLVRNGTAVGGGDNSGTSRQSAMTGIIFDAGAGYTQYNAYSVGFNFLDSPATTSAVTYQVQARHVGAGTLYVGRSTNWGNASDYAAWSSNLLLMEVDG